MPSDLPSSVTRPKHHRGKIIITTDTSTSGADWQLDPDGGSISLQFYWEISKQKGTFQEPFTLLQIAAFEMKKVDSVCLPFHFVLSERSRWTQCIAGNAVEVLREAGKSKDQGHAGWDRSFTIGRKSNSLENTLSAPNWPAGIRSHSKTWSVLVHLF